MNIFLAGTMQGAHCDHSIIDQAYRSELREIMLARYPGSTIICPLALIQERLGASTMDELLALHRTHSTLPFVEPSAIGEPLSAVLLAFHELVSLAKTSDLLVAYLPDRIPSMGTAIEMWAACSSGVRVICVTELTQNLAVLASSTVVVRSLACLREYLRQH